MRTGRRAPARFTGGSRGATVTGGDRGQMATGGRIGLRLARGVRGVAHAVASVSLRDPFTSALDSMSASAAGAYSVDRRLRSAYTGDAIHVRRDSDDDETDIGYDARGYVNTITLASFCDGANGYLVTAYDNSGNGRDYTQADSAMQPKIYDATEGRIALGENTAINFDGIDDVIERGDSLGISGSEAWTVAFAGAAVLDVVDGCPFTLGAFLNSSSCHFTDAGTLQVYNRVAGATGWRLFNAVASPAMAGYHVVEHPAGGAASSVVWRQNGSECTEQAVVNGALVPDVADTSSRIGEYAGPGNPLHGTFTGWLAFNSILSAGDLALLEAELAAHSGA